MAGHNKFSKIKHKKADNDAKKSAVFTKVLRKVTMATANGDTDPKTNAKLRLAILAAKEANVPKSRILDAIKRAANPNEGVLHESRYEGFLDSVGIIIEVVTNSLSRSLHDMKLVFKQHGGSLAASGTVTHAFQNLGFITYPKDLKSEDEMLELALEAGAEDCALVEDEYEIVSKHDHLHKVKENLEKTLGEPLRAKLIWKPNNPLTVSKDTTEKTLKLIEHLEDLDDVQSVFSNLSIPERFNLESEE